MNPRRLLLLALLFAAAGCSRADRAPLPGDSVSLDGAVALTPGRVPLGPAPASSPARDAPNAPNAIENKLFPPELVMEHQGALGITAEQRRTIEKEVEGAHTKLLKIQWELDADKEKLLAVLDGPRVDESASERAAADVMKREVAIKSAHLAMLVRIKNLLTEEQQAQLRTIREADRCGAARDGG